MDNALQNFQHWLNQSLPLFWLVTVITFSVIGYLVVNSRNKKRLQDLQQQRHDLEISKATNEQQIELISLNNRSLSEKIDASTLQFSALMAEKAELKNSRDEKALQLSTSENERHGLREMVDNSNRKISRLEADVREQNAKLAAEKEKLNELKSQFEIQKGQLKTEFKVVSEEIIKERQSMLTEQNKEGVNALLKPLRDQIEGFQKRVNEVHDESVKGNTNLKSEIENVMKMGIKMRDEASSLTTALKGDSQQRGAWGEAQLERTLEMSGLIENEHYEKQNSFTDDTGRRKQTDYLIKLPGDKCIIIDSKVSLNAYERAFATQDINEQAQAIKNHVAAVRSHINDLASKEYTNLSALHSPDFVLMFMPVEPAYIEAMKQDPELFGFGYSKNIILVSHTTLIPILRTVANLWMLDRSNKEARQIGEKANDIFNSVVLVSERLGKLGKTLNTASTHFNDTVTSLTGMQSKVKGFNKLSNKVKKTMPELEPKEMQFDTTKLNALAISNDTTGSDSDQ
jgi:DNA recombination protein RmuC